MKTIFHLLLILAFIFSFSCAGGEEGEKDSKKPSFPPLKSWADVTDITDKVIQWDVPYANVEEYSIYDEIPLLESYSPLCSAPEGWNSFAHGGKFPRQTYFFDKNFAPNRRYLTFIDSDSHYCSGNLMKFYWHLEKILEALPPARKSSPAFPFWETLAAKKSFEKNFKQPSSSRMIELINRHMLCLSINRKQYYNKLIITSALIVKVQKNGDYIQEPVPQLQGAEFIHAFSRTTGNVGNQLIALKDGKTLCFDGKSFRQLPFHYKSIYGHEIWEPYMAYSADSKSLLIRECNWGVNRNLEPPENPQYILDGWGRLKREAYIKWKQEHTIKPERRKCMMAVLDLTTGKFVRKYEDVYNGWLATSSRLILPGVVKNGKFHLAVIEEGQPLGIIPYASFFFSELKYKIERPAFYTFMSPKSAVFIDFEKGVFRKYLFDFVTDNDLFTCPTGQRIFVSKPFLREGKSVRKFVALEDNLKKTFSFLVEDFVAVDAKKCDLIYHIHKGKLVIFAGKNYVSIDINIGDKK